MVATFASSQRHFKIPFEQLEGGSGDAVTLEAVLQTLPSQFPSRLSRYIKEVGGCKAPPGTRRSSQAAAIALCRP